MTKNKSFNGMYYSKETANKALLFVRVLTNKKVQKAIVILGEYPEGMTVCKFADTMGERQTSATSILNSMRKYGIVVSARNGKYIHNRIPPDMGENVNLLLQHFTENLQ